MSVLIQRLVYYVKPTKDHRDLFEWETAIAVIFVRAVEQRDGIHGARELLRSQEWQPIRLILHDPLSARRVVEEGGDVLATYRVAEEKGISCTFFPETFAGGKKQRRILSPELGEAFVDRIIESSGGRRLTRAECGIDSRNADYRLDNWILELKDLREEGLEKTTRQEKLAQLFSGENWGSHVDIRAGDLKDKELMIYLDVVGGPIKSQVRSAADQIRKTMDRIGNSDLNGGLIFLNTGYGSLPPSVFEKLVERYAAKYPAEIGFCICISAWVLTNGFDWQILFSFHPLESPHPIVKKVSNAFSAVTNELMTEWARSGFKARRPVMPLKPIAFEIAGRSFSWEPERIPPTWCE